MKLTGRPQWAAFAFDKSDPAETAAFTTFFTARMLRKGFLANGSFACMLSHQDHHVDAYLAAVDDVFGELNDAVKKGKVKESIGGPVKHTGFARLT